MRPRATTDSVRAYTASSRSRRRSGATSRRTMVRAVVVYESVYGNTRAVAEAIAAGLADHADVALRRVAEVDAEALHGARLLVVGGPTHMHGLATSLSRRMAVKAAEEDGHTDVEPHASEEPGLRAWLSALDGADL